MQKKHYKQVTAIQRKQRRTTDPIEKTQRIVFL